MENNTIVIVNDFNYTQGGASKVAIDTAKLLANHQIKTIFFSSTKKDHIDGVEEAGPNQYEALKDPNRIRGAIQGIWNFKAKKEFKKLLTTLDPNSTVIHVHGWTKSLSSSFFKVAFKKKFKVIITIHDYFLACPNGGFLDYSKNHTCPYKAYSKSCLKSNCDSRNYGYKIYRLIRGFIQKHIAKIPKNLDYVITISDFSYDKVRLYLNSNTIVRKISNPIPIHQEKRIEVEKNNTYLYVGRVSKEKGVDLFCEAMTRLELPATVVGDGDLLEQLKNKYPNINFTGWKTSTEVRNYMKASKVFIFPSYWYEGAPLTILEALSLGLPCIVSDGCAGKEFIDDSNGVTFKNESLDDLIEKIKLFDQDRIEKCSKGAYQTYWNHPYSEERYYKNLSDYYKEILKGVK